MQLFSYQLVSQIDAHDAWLESIARKWHQLVSESCTKLIATLSEHHDIGIQF